MSRAGARRGAETRDRTLYHRGSRSTRPRPAYGTGHTVAARRRRARPARPAHAEVRIESLAAGGDGVAHLPDGRAVFVPLSAPGDLVNVKVIEERRRFARAEIERILEPGRSRRSPLCPHFGHCGGCTWQHVEYDAQLAAKRQIVFDALTRIGGVEPSVLDRTGEGSALRMTPSPDEYRYRGRARLLVQDGRVGFRERRSHRVRAVSSCPVLSEPLDAELGRLARRVEAGVERRAANDRTEIEWEIAVGHDGRTRANPTTDGSGSVGGSDPASERIWLAGDENATVALSPGTFAQANVLLFEPLRDAVCGAAGSGAYALELYSGAGFFTLPLARAFTRLCAVEAAPSAVADLRCNVGDASLPNVEICAERVEDVLDRMARTRAPGPIDVVVLDPPRAGLVTGAAETLARLDAARIVYLSCDPATLARDVRSLLAQGHVLRSVEGFDLFPQTPHVEVLVVLERSGGEPTGGPRGQGSIRP